MLNFHLCDKQRGVSPSGPTPGGHLQHLRKQEESDEWRPQEQQAGTDAGGAIAVVALTAGYVSPDGCFELQIDAF